MVAHDHVEPTAIESTLDLDDIDAYVATLRDNERAELVAADMALDIAMVLHRARERRGLSQAGAASRAGLRQQAVSRLERPGRNIQIATLQKYLGALGYALELDVIDIATGESAARVVLALDDPPAQPHDPQSASRH